MTGPGTTPPRSPTQAAETGSRRTGETRCGNRRPRGGLRGEPVLSRGVEGVPGAGSRGADGPGRRSVAPGGRGGVAVPVLRLSDRPSDWVASLTWERAQVSRRRMLALCAKMGETGRFVL
ncbi:hypothetical protein GCM10009603_26660 [Nocardiopsis exhalans]